MCCFFAACWCWYLSLPLHKSHHLSSIYSREHKMWNTSSDSEWKNCTSTQCEWGSFLCWHCLWGRLHVTGSNFDLWSGKMEFGWDTLHRHLHTWVIFSFQGKKVTNEKRAVTTNTRFCLLQLIPKTADPHLKLTMQLLRLLIRNGTCLALKLLISVVLRTIKVDTTLRRFDVRMETGRRVTLRAHVCISIFLICSGF